jgi:hypothetical protein
MASFRSSSASPCHHVFCNGIGHGHAVVERLHWAIVCLDDRVERLDLFLWTAGWAIS